MLIDVDHLTRYTYSGAVRLDTQLLRMRPREDAHQRLERFELRVQPAGARVADSTDPEGNTVTAVQVDGTVAMFEVLARSRVATTPPAPLGDEAPARFPLHYPPDVPWQVLGYRGVPSDPAVNRFAAEVADGARGEVLPFLTLLAARIHRTHAYEMRPLDPPRPPALTLELKQGACRDFAVLYVEACRALGLAARFVSGYRLREREGVGHELHAWAECYVPGLGWRGYDPTIGKAVVDHHVAVAAGSPATAAPVTGAYWGSASSQLTASVEARRVAPAVAGTA